MADTGQSDAVRVNLEVVGSVATVTLVRSARMNAFDAAMHGALRDALAQVSSNPAVRVLVLTGSGRAFSTGQDLGERARTFELGEVPDLLASLESNYNPLIRTIAALPIPVIAAVNGMAFGAGAALAVACDIVIAGRSAKFQFGFVNVGLGPDSGASWSLPRAIGQTRALDLALTGRPVLANEALAIGLVARVVADEELADVAAQVAGELAARSPAALTAIKQLMWANPSQSLDAALDAERDAQARLGRTPEYREAVLRFARARN